MNRTGCQKIPGNPPLDLSIGGVVATDGCFCYTARNSNRKRERKQASAARHMTKIDVDEIVDESALIERAKEDQDAFGQLYERYSQRIYQYIYYRTGSEPDAEDLAAKTFMRAWQHMATYDDRGVPFSAWLYRIAHNLVANWHRDRSRRKIISLDDLSRWQVNEDGPEAMALFSEDRAVLLQAVRRLPADRQELLSLKFVEHLSNAEIGNVMGRSEGAIKSLYHRTLMNLREDLQHEFTPETRSSSIRRLLGRFGDKRAGRE
jgi:RNA polymerase sigma-70 factor (ECF subfamily)